VKIPSSKIWLAKKPDMENIINKSGKKNEWARWALGTVIAIGAAGGGFIALFGYFDDDVDSIEFDPDVTQQEVIVGSKTTLGLNQRDANGRPTSEKITWTSNDPTIAAVSNNGVVSAIKEGSTNIVARAENVQKSMTINVKSNNGNDDKPAPVVKKYMLRQQISKIGGWKHKGGDKDIYSKNGRKTLVELKSTTKVSRNNIVVSVYFRVREERRDYTEFYGTLKKTFPVKEGKLIRIDTGDINFSRSVRDKVRDKKIKNFGYWKDITVHIDSYGDDHKYVGFSGSVSIPYYVEVSQ
jgi:hypothetical protein